jgi:hypothetical protein
MASKAALALREVRVLESIDNRLARIEAKLGIVSEPESADAEQADAEQADAEPAPTSEAQPEAVVEAEGNSETAEPEVAPARRGKKQ